MTKFEELELHLKNHTYEQEIINKGNRTLFEEAAREILHVLIATEIQAEITLDRMKSRWR